MNKPDDSAEPQGKIAADFFLMERCLGILKSNPQLIIEAICEWGYVLPAEVADSDLSYMYHCSADSSGKAVAYVHVFMLEEESPDIPIAGLVFLFSSSGKKVRVSTDLEGKEKSDLLWKIICSEKEELEAKKAGTARTLH